MFEPGSPSDPRCGVKGHTHNCVGGQEGRAWGWGYTAGRLAASLALVGTIELGAESWTLMIIMVEGLYAVSVPVLVPTTVYIY